MQQEGILKEMRKREHFQKPSEVRVVEARDAVKREHKRQRLEKERLGY